VTRFIGGAVLEKGAVQEEIRFLISPELLPALCFCEKMTDTESVWVVGSQVFTEYQGYGNGLKLIGKHINDKKALDQQGRVKSVVCAIDAIKFREEESHLQFRPDKIVRELVKAYSGFGQHMQM
jgi:poly(ADP-ribose) glycohydrolase